MRSNLSVISVYNKKNTKSKVVTQLLYGDAFKILKKNGSWVKIKNDLDNYKGFIKKKNFLPNQKNTHKVHNLYAKLYSKPKIKNMLKQKLCFGSKIKVTKKYFSSNSLHLRIADIINFKTDQCFIYVFRLYC